MNSNYFSKGEVITNGKGNLLVTKIYRMNWIKRVLTKLKIKKNWFIGIKVKSI